MESPPALLVREPRRADEMIAEEADLQAMGGSLVRVGTLSERALSIGVAEPATAPAVRAAERLGIPVYRRRTGGSGILNEPGDVTYSIVLPRNHPRVGRDYLRAYARLGAGVGVFLARRGVAARWGPPHDRSSEFCLLGARGEVCESSGRVLGGAAQRMTSKTLLHHGLLLASVDRARISQIFGLQEDLLREELTSLTELGVAPLSPRGLEELGRDLVASLTPGPPEESRSQ